MTIPALELKQVRKIFLKKNQKARFFRSKREEVVALEQVDTVHPPV